MQHLCRVVPCGAVVAQDSLRWLKVASLLPGKNHEDVRYRYQRLMYDVHKIENAIPVCA